MSEICNECGESVAFGSGKFANRIASGDTKEAREEMGSPFPEGDFQCEICWDKICRDAEMPSWGEICGDAEMPIDYDTYDTFANGRY